MHRLRAPAAPTERESVAGAVNALVIGSMNAMTGAKRRESAITGDVFIALDVRNLTTSVLYTGFRL